MTRPAGRTGALSTKRLLLAHMCVLGVLLVLGSSALLSSYVAVQRTAEQMHSDMTLAVQEVAASQKALSAAHEAAKKTAGDGLTDEVGAGEKHRLQLSAADQSLSRVAERNLPGDDGRRELEQVNGLLTVYADAVGQATGKYADDGLMRRQKFGEAESVLEREGTGIVDRLEKLQADQVETMRERVSVGSVQTAGWVAAEVSLLLLGAALVSASCMLFRRTGRWVNLWLLAAVSVTVPLATVPLRFTLKTQHELTDARGYLARIQDAPGRLETGRAAQLREPLAAVGPDWWWILAGCLLMLFLVAMGLGRRWHIDYRRTAP